MSYLQYLKENGTLSFLVWFASSLTLIVVGFVIGLSQEYGAYLFFAGIFEIVIVPVSVTVKAVIEDQNESYHDWLQRKRLDSSTTKGESQ